MSIAPKAVTRLAGALALAATIAAPVAAAEFKVTTIVDGLDHPWAAAWLPDGTMLVTELSGQLRVIRNGQLDPEPVKGVPEVFYAGQGGLSDVVPHPEFARNQLVYLTYSAGTRRANATHVARGRLEGNELKDLEVIFIADPMKDTAVHYGARLLFLPDGTFLLTIGDGFDYREEAQNLDNHFGTVVRLNADGSVPEDNPFVGQEGKKPEIWTYGHRNQQGLIRDAATGRVYLHEHGPRGGDEINVLEKGANYGWPIATYGVDYSGAKISPYTEYEGTVQPMVNWTPSIAPAGFALYTGPDFPDWQGDLFIGALALTHLRRVDMEDGEPVDQEVLLADLDERIREVRQGPDGRLYVLTDGSGGKVLRLDPKG